MCCEHLALDAGGGKESLLSSPKSNGRREFSALITYRVILNLWILRKTKMLSLTPALRELVREGSDSLSASRQCSLKMNKFKEKLRHQRSVHGPQE